MTAQLDSARDLAEHRIYVFPVKERGKLPLTPHGFKDATIDERQILHLWAAVPGANVGIDLKRSELFVVDIDPKEGVDPHEVIAALMLDVEALSVVLTGEAPEPSDEYPNSLAGVRGMHLYFRGHHPTVKTSIPGVEVRGDGSYVVAPGSIHESGVEYAWTHGRYAAPEPPETMRVFLNGARRRADNGAAPRVEGIIAAGERNSTLTSLAGSMRRRGMGEAEILVALREINKRCVPPLDEHDLATIARSVSRYPPEPIAAPPKIEIAAPIKRGKRIVDMDAAINAALEPLPWICEPIACAGAVTTIAGARAERKSWLAMFVCAAVGRGGTVADMRTRRGATVYVDAENGYRVMGRRFRDMGLDAEAFAVADGNGLRLPSDMAELRQIIVDENATLCVLDSLRRLAPGAREDKSDDMAPIFAGLAAIAQTTGCAIVVLHHRSIKPGAPDTRGSSAIEDQSDLIYVLERDFRDPEARFRKRLRCIKNRVDVEARPKWLRFDRIAGFLSLGIAEAFVAPDADDEPSAVDDLIDRIRALAYRVAEDGAWPPGRIAEALGTTQDHGTFKRALARIVDDGEWFAQGATRSRVYGPNIRANDPKADPKETQDPLFPDGSGDSDKPDSGQGFDPNWEPYRPELPEDDEEEGDEDDWRQR